MQLVDNINQQNYILRVLLVHKEHRIPMNGARWFLPKKHLLNSRLGLDIDRVRYWLNKYQNRKWLVYRYPRILKAKNPEFGNGFSFETIRTNLLIAYYKKLNPKKIDPVFNVVTRILTAGGRESRFNRGKKETSAYLVFEYLCRHQDRYVSNEELFDHCQKASLSPNIPRVIFDLNIKKLHPLGSNLEIEGGGKGSKLSEFVFITPL